MKFTSFAALACLSVVLGAETTLNTAGEMTRSSHHRMLNAVTKPLPAMTFFVPLQEQDTFNNVFRQLGGNDLRAPMVVMLSVTISTDKTVIWYDHWEDGFDIDSSSSTLPVGKTTEIWGDGNAANGCAPHIKKTDCTNMRDILNAGTSIVVQNDVPLPRSRGTVVYDGGDRIQSSFTVAVTRASFPKSPGSVMAGAVEVYDTLTWGTFYEAPAGAGTKLTNNTDPFEVSAFSCLASEDNTVVTLPNKTTLTLAMGQSIHVPVVKSDQVQSDKPIQVVLLTLDKGSTYQTRWFTMRPVAAFEKSYVSPVGDTYANTAIVVYNPTANEVSYTVTTLVNRTITTVTKTLVSKQAAITGVIPTGSGALIEATDKIVALSLTDTNDMTNFGKHDTNGDRYDWGIPLVPRNELTSQVQIGMGYGCTNNFCGTREVRNPVWLTPMADADIYIDYNNTGVNQERFMNRTVRYLESVIITDRDKDMSGASIFAVKAGQPKDGETVDIAVAWGQNPAVSDPDQSFSMDFGVTVPPFTLVTVAKTVDKVLVTANEEMTYTIRVSNVGHKNVAANTYKLVDVLDPLVTYIPLSTRISESSGSTVLLPVPDDSSGTEFPLDSGYVIPVDLPRRGGTIEIVFKVKTAAQLDRNKIVNKGILESPSGGKTPFEATSWVDLGASILIENTVYSGLDGGAKCGTSAAGESVTGPLAMNVTYCFVVKNNGRAHLGAVTITNDDVFYKFTFPGLLAPNTSRTVFVNESLNGTLLNTAVVVGTPVQGASGGAIPNVPNVMSTDPSNVVSNTPIPGVAIRNVVYIGTDDGATCRTAGVEKVTQIQYTEIVFCFTIVNTGKTHLRQLSLTNPKLNSYTRVVDVLLAPGQNTTVSLANEIDGDETNIVTVVAQTVDSAGVIIPRLGTVTNSDSSQVDQIDYTDEISVDNTVYIGTDGGVQCGTPEAVNERSGKWGTNVTYCFKLTNTGASHLNKIELRNPLLNYQNANVLGTTGILAPQESIVLHLESFIGATLENNATAYGIAVTAGGKPIPNRNVQTDWDLSKVILQVGTPKIEITNRVLLGHDTAACGTNAAKKYVEDFKETKVTYCFLITNSGATYLNVTSLRAPELEFTDTQVRLLAPGVSTTITTLKTITGTVENTATVVGTPVTPVGGILPSTNDVTASDKSKVGEIVVRAEVNIANTVYLGQNTHKSCNTAVEKVDGLFGDAITFCFNITNTGNTHLDTFRINNVKLDFEEDPAFTLSPGAHTIVTVPRTIAVAMSNTATVTARPTRPDGSSLALPEVTHQDDSAVGRLPHKPSIAINNTVYVGEAGSCNKGVDLVRDIFQTNVTYCLAVKNTGDSHLDQIKIVDTELNFTETLLQILGPGETALISVPGQITKDLENKAVVTANPILSCGTDILETPDVTAEDKSKVEKQVFAASITIANTVYLGHDSGKSCGTSGESVQGLYGSNATFCFTVTNNGQTHLRSLTLSNVVLGYNDILSQPLAPGATTTVSFPGKIYATEDNMVNVSAVPTTEAGRDILDLPEVEAGDTSRVELLKHSPVITIANTVYLGNDGGKSCATSQESVSEQFGKAVTYCFIITNNGNSHLNSIQIVNEKLGYSNGTTINLAPGASTLLTTTGKISTNLTNTAVVIATPSMPDGTQIPNHDLVNANDPSTVVVVAHKSGINIENTVYLAGSDEGAKCATGVESVSGYPNTGVMYCFEIKNVGESHLKDIVIKNTDLNLTDSSIKLLAPLETKVVAISRMITKDLLNTATATGTPALSDGTTIANTNSVVDSDTSAVDQLEYAPKVTIENSVYVGRSSDNLCGTGAARDGVDGIHGTAVTYCFAIKNTGNTPLKNVVIGNVNLDNYNSPVKDLAVNETVVVPLEKTITVDLTNTAIVTATPTITGLSPVTSKDDSLVNKLDFIPGVKIVNHVYLGSGDNGVKCGTDAASETVEGNFGSDVVYCFTVTNTGDTHLADIKVTNADVGYTSSGLEPLASGASITVSVPGKITKELKNVAYVTANPTTSSGQDIPDLANVNSNDDSKVTIVGTPSGVQIANTVYAGKDGGVQCGTPAAVETVTARFSTSVTFCFLVVNTGKSHLTNVTVDNKELKYTTTIDILAPNATKMLVVEGTLEATKTNVAIVTGTPSLKDGTVIPSADKVRAQDPSYVVRTPDVARIHIDNTVVLGADSAKCSSASNFVEHYTGAVVTYCFKVTNGGETHLTNVTIDNLLLNFTNSKIGTLKPLETVLVAYTAKITSALSNMAKVTGNPALPDGKDLPDVNDVTWSDGSAVGLLEYKPKVKVENTVYVGEDGGSSCGTKGVETASGKPSTKVVYCFKITNIGDTHLNNLKIVNKELNFTGSSVDLLGPQSSITVVFPSTIAGNLTNNVVVTGNPSLADGTDISGAQDVTATDPSAVTLITTDGKEKEEPKVPYSPPNSTQECMQDKWTKAGKQGTLVCATKQVSWETLSSTKTHKCKLGEKINITVDGTMRIDGPRQDIGWYVAADGGDALTGKCIINGFQSAFNYTLFKQLKAPAATPVTVPAATPFKAPAATPVTAAIPVKAPAATPVTAATPVKAPVATPVKATPTVTMIKTPFETVKTPVRAPGTPVQAPGTVVRTRAFVNRDLSEVSTGKIVWLVPDGGDGDKCGDVTGPAERSILPTPALVNAEVTCADENQDGILDVSICFTWRAPGNDQLCDINGNIPGTSSSCYCTRYDIKNITVDKPPTETGVC